MKRPFVPEYAKAMHRRDFLKALGVIGTGIVVPELVMPERRIWQVSASAPVDRSSVYDRLGLHDSLGPKALCASVPIELSLETSNAEIYRRFMSQMSENVTRELDQAALDAIARSLGDAADAIREQRGNRTFLVMPYETRIRG